MLSLTVVTSVAMNLEAFAQISQPIRPAGPANAVALASITLEEFVRRIDTAHPEKSIDDKQVSLAKSAIEQAGRLMDPQIAVGRERNPLPFLSPMQKADMGADPSPDKSSAAWALSVTQMFPWPGTLSAQKNAAQARVSRSEASFEVNRLTRQMEAADFFLALIRLAERTEIEKQNLIQAQLIIKYSGARLSHGIGSHQELLQAQNEQIVIATNIKAMETQLANLTDYARALITTSPAEASQMNFVLKFPDSGPAVLKSNQDPTVNRIQTAQAETLAQLNAQQAQTMPEIMTQAMLMREDSGMWMVGAMVGVRLPVFSQAERQSLENQKMTVSSKTMESLTWHEKKKQIALSQLARQLSQLEFTLKTLRLNIIPNSKEHLKSALAEFSQGKGSIRTVTDARKSLLTFEDSEILFKEHVLKSQLAQQKAFFGFTDDVLNADIPQLSSSAMGNSEMNPSGQMGGMKNGMKMKKKSRPESYRKSAPIEDDATPNAGGGMGGMGGM